MIEAVTCVREGEGGREGEIFPYHSGPSKKSRLHLLILLAFLICTRRKLAKEHPDWLPCLYRILVHACVCAAFSCVCVCVTDSCVCVQCSRVRGCDGFLCVRAVFLYVAIIGASVVFLRMCAHAYVCVCVCVCQRGSPTLSTPLHSAHISSHTKRHANMWETTKVMLTKSSLL